MYDEGPARIAWFLIVVGFNVTFFPQFILGLEGMPRRYYSYLPEFTFLNRLSTVGSWMIAAGFLYTAWYFGKALKNGPIAPANPWEANTLEWQTASPPPTENFLETPIVTEWPYEYRPDMTHVPQNA